MPVRILLSAFLLTFLLPVSLATEAQYTVQLKFPDQTVEICTSPGFTLNYLTLSVNVTACNSDTIFDNGFEKSE